MPKDKSSGVPRQRPVSCRFCRTRKLRCDRQQPCSNCVSRNVYCELDYPIAAPVKNLTQSDNDLVERIRKLEKLLENQSSLQNANVNQYAPRHDPHEDQLLYPSPPAQSEPLDNDVALLESIYSTQPLTDTLPSTKVVIKTCAMQQILEKSPYVSQTGSLIQPTRCIWLPEYSEAKLLLKKYVQDADHLHHMIHIPSLPAILDGVYANLNRQRHIQPGTLILLISIYASCTHSWLPKDCELGIFSSSPQAHMQTPYWIKTVEDVLDIAHRTTRISIEGIQGIIIASFISANFQGFSRRCRSLYTMALLLARELGLHCLDHPSNAHLANHAQTEIGRRTWWYIVATDWCIAARFRGPFQGVYQCHTNQMMVRKPLNINDEEVVDGMTCQAGRPLSEPTDMSYVLFRLRLAEVSRNIVDRTMIVNTPAFGLSEDKVLDIDSELQMLLKDIPPFFSMSVEQLMDNYQLDLSRAKKIAHQGYMIHSMLYGQRCKLHFPYFGRGLPGPSYVSSREICLQSAYLVIRTEVLFEKSEACKATWYRYAGLLMGVFTASIVLLIDLCHSKSSEQQEKRRGEIAEAIRILEDARHDSDTAARFLDSLMQILRKHKVADPARTEKQPLKFGIDTEPLSTPSSGALVHNSTSGLSHCESLSSIAPCYVPGLCEVNSINAVGDRSTNGEDLSSYFTELAQSFEQGVDVSGFDWNNIFLGLDSSFI